MKRLRKIFECLKEYYEGDNPFRSKTLMRSEREEQGMVVHRQAFTKEQEEQILTVLSDSDPNHKVKNKAEIRIVYIIDMFTGQRLKVVSGLDVEKRCRIDTPSERWNVFHRSTVAVRGSPLFRCPPCMAFFAHNLKSISSFLFFSRHFQ